MLESFLLVTSLSSLDPIGSMVLPAAPAFRGNPVSERNGERAT